MKTYVIYGIVDPTNGKIFYIGSTSNLKIRKSGHFLEALKGRGGKKGFLIRKIAELGLVPEFRILANAESRLHAFRIEAEHIVLNHKTVTNRSFSSVLIGRLSGIHLKRGSRDSFDCPGYRNEKAERILSCRIIKRSIKGPVNNVAVKRDVHLQCKLAAIDAGMSLQEFVEKLVEWSLDNIDKPESERAELLV